MKRSAPSSIYRLQLHAGFDFDAAGEIADYLNALGVSHVYCSPYLQAAKGSTHGYDVVDHSRVNEELGGTAGHERFCETLRRNRLGQVLDTVPNHMAITGRENLWWWDVLENGPASPYASYFDVEWHAPEEKLRNKVLVPILGEHYGRVVQSGQIQLARHNGGFEVRYAEHALPVAPHSLRDVLAAAAVRAQSEVLSFLADSFGRLPLPTVTEREQLLARHRDKNVIQLLLTRLCREDHQVCQAIDRVIEELNREAVSLDAFLENQNYRVAFWKTAGRELGHRRFFDVNTLIGLRIEEPQVFEDTHRLLIRWLDRGVVDGLRIDHPDGLLDPKQYFERLARAAPNAWIVAEKILEPGESLPDNWPAAGTTGYDFLNALNGLFIDPAGEEPLTRIYEAFTGERAAFPELAREKKHLVLRDVLGSDVNRLTALFKEICDTDREHRDHTRHDIHHALRETIACFPVYRTSVRADYGEIAAADQRYIDEAITLAKQRRPDLDGDLFDFLRSVLTLVSVGSLKSEFVMRFQQFTGSATAKGVEDTAFYCYHRLTSLNEVGGAPERFGLSVEGFHGFCEQLSAAHPATMVTTATHDTKRSEDVRARLNVLSEIPEDWGGAVNRWALLSEPYGQDGLPDRNTLYLLFQTLVGAWPIAEERLQAYMLKASREAKQQTSWLTPNERFEESLRHFIAALFGNRELLADVETFVQRIEAAGLVNSLSQVLLKLTATGVPDLYQGTELWDWSLVDPDNRRPVDYALRRRLLPELGGLSAEQILARGAEGLPKLWVIYRSLRLRRERPESFMSPYRQVQVLGADSPRALAFGRGPDVLVLVPRLPMARGSAGDEARIDVPAGGWQNRLTGESWEGGRHAVADLLRRFPVALFSKETEA